MNGKRLVFLLVLVVCFGMLLGVAGADDNNSTVTPESIVRDSAEGQYYMGLGLIGVFCFATGLRLGQAT